MGVNSHIAGELCNSLTTASSFRISMKPQTMRKHLMAIINLNQESTENNSYTGSEMFLQLPEMIVHSIYGLQQEIIPITLPFTYYILPDFLKLSNNMSITDNEELGDYATGLDTHQILRRKEI